MRINAPPRNSKTLYITAAIAALILFFIVISAPVYALDTSYISQENDPASIIHYMNDFVHHHISITKIAGQIGNSLTSYREIPYSGTQMCFINKETSFIPIYWWWVVGIAFISIILTLLLGTSLSGRIISSLAAGFCTFWLTFYSLFSEYVAHIPLGPYCIALVSIAFSLFLAWRRKDLAAGLLNILISMGMLIIVYLYQGFVIWILTGLPYLIAGVLLFTVGLRAIIRRRKSSET